jgi:hypothetical protein
MTEPDMTEVVACPHCGARGKKEQMDLRLETFIDPSTGATENRFLHIWHSPPYMTRFMCPNHG